MHAPDGPDDHLEADPGPPRRVVVDGETFDVRRDRAQDATHFDWVSGPNDGYGFTTGPTPDSDEEVVENIREFLGQIDPETGYIED